MISRFEGSVVFKTKHQNKTTCAHSQKTRSEPMVQALSSFHKYLERRGREIILSLECHIQN